MKNANPELEENPAVRRRWFGLEAMEPVVLYDMLALREAIFVVEQNCIYHELDGLDKQARHLLVKHKELVIACLRLLPPDEESSKARIGRVAVSAQWRKRGLARVMVTDAIEKARLDYPGSGVGLSAQTYLQAFYASLGFRVCGPEFLEDGIPHLPMEL